MISENEVFVGDKHIGNYLEAVEHQLDENDSVDLLARGQKNNGKAIDVACISRRDYEDVKISDVEFSTEEFTNDEGEDHRVSGVRITLE